MKLLGKILYFILIFIFALQVFGIVNQVATNKSIADYGDEAVLNNDYKFFNSIFEFYRDELIINIIEEEFELKIFNVSTKDNNILLFLVEGLDSKEIGNELKLEVSLKSGNKVEQSLISVGKENWYLQWLYLDRLYQNQVIEEDIMEISILKANKESLFELSNGNIPLIAYNDYDIVSYLSNENNLYSYVNKTLLVDEVEFVKNIVNEQKHNLNFKVQVNLEEEVNEVYVIGNFNDFNLEDKTYKLTFNDKTKLYEKEFEDVTLFDNNLEYVVVINGKVEVNNENEIITYQKALSVKDELELFQINKVVDRAKLSKYNWIKWLGMGTYILLSGLLSYFLFFRKKKAHAIYNSAKQNTTEPTVKENMNIKQIEETIERDESVGLPSNSDTPEDNNKN